MLPLLSAGLLDTKAMRTPCDVTCDMQSSQRFEALCQLHVYQAMYARVQKELEKAHLYHLSAEKGLPRIA